MSCPVVVAERGREGRKDERPEPEPESRTTKSLDWEDREEGEEQPSCHADAEGARAHIRCYDNLRGIITSGQQRASATDGGLAWDRGFAMGPSHPRQTLVNSAPARCNQSAICTPTGPIAGHLWESLGEEDDGDRGDGWRGAGQGREDGDRKPSRQTRRLSRPCYRVDYTIGTIQIARRVYWPTA